MRDISKEFGLNYLIRKPSSPSYTLAEIEQLAREYVDEAVNRTTDQLVLSLFLAWLAKQEQGKESRDDT